MHDLEIDCDVLFQYCDLREIYDPIEVFNIALQYESIPYRKWTSPLNLKEMGMDILDLHEKCALQLGWELAGKDTTRDRADMSVDELIGLGESEAENLLSGLTATWTPTRAKSTPRSTPKRRLSRHCSPNVSGKGQEMRGAGFCGFCPSHLHPIPRF